jgi:hypothetical protein
MRRTLIFLVIICVGLYAYMHIALMNEEMLPARASVLSFSKPLPTSVTIGWVGDMVPSQDDIYNSFAFARVASVLQQPDVMIGNLEGTFASEDNISKCEFIKTSCHAFRGNASFADALKYAGFDVVSLINNHSYDYGREGLRQTMVELDRVGIPYISAENPSTSITAKGKHIGILGVSSTPPLETINNYEYIILNIKKLKETNDIVILIFHGGAEGADKTMVPDAEEYMGTEHRGNVRLVAHTAVDAGADLVLGAGPHVLRKIEHYHSVPIAYSLGNFVGGKRLVTKDILGVSGIFTATFKKDTVKTSFISVVLSADGTPGIDLAEGGKTLVESLSQ